MAVTATRRIGVLIGHIWMGLTYITEQVSPEYDMLEEWTSTDTQKLKVPRSMTYSSDIARLMGSTIFGEIDIETPIEIRKPTAASSLFLTNKEQGDWAEQIVLTAINNTMEDYKAIKYGRDDDLSAGDPGFEEHFDSYVEELNEIGKRPDILVFHKHQVSDNYSINDPEFVKSAVAALEVRSSSFLINKYNQFMNNRRAKARAAVVAALNSLKSEPYSTTLQQKKPELYDIIQAATPDNIQNLNFTVPGWRSSSISKSSTLKELKGNLVLLKENIVTLQKRDYLSITPKVEDLILVNRWIQNFGVRHFYLQVFFDKAYVISFKKILELLNDPKNEGAVFSIEGDVKNQYKLAIKIDVAISEEILSGIDMPEHISRFKQLERGRLLYYVTFNDGRGHLDSEVFLNEVING